MAIHFFSRWFPRILCLILILFIIKRQRLDPESMEAQTHAKICLKYLLLVSHLVVSFLFVTPWTAARQVPLPKRFFQARILEQVAIFFSCPPPEDLPDPGTEPTSLASPTLAGRLFTTQPPGNPNMYIYVCIYIIYIYVACGKKSLPFFFVCLFFYPQEQVPMSSYQPVLARLIQIYDYFSWRLIKFKIYPEFFLIKLYYLSLHIYTHYLLMVCMLKSELPKWCQWYRTPCQCKRHK